MSLARFSVIVSLDAEGGIAKEGAMPWHSSTDMKFFRQTTVGRGKNVVIMGRKTYETIPHPPLQNRKCCVLSRTWNQSEHYAVSVYSSIPEVLADLGATRKRYDTIYLIGGESVYHQFLQQYIYLCDKIYVTKFREIYDCDKTFPWEVVQYFRQVETPSVFHTHTRYQLSPDVVHGEHSYLDLLREILDKGEVCTDRAGVSRQTVFARQLRFDLTRTIPVCTTKKVDHEAALKVLLFYVGGGTDASVLSEQQIKTWEEATSSEGLAGRGLDYKAGNMGPMYGHQWRRSGAPYRPGEDACEAPLSEGEVDQLTAVVEKLKSDPYSRQHLLTAWSPTEIDQMASVPTHFACQFSVSGDGEFLDCLVSHRSAECFVDLPFDICLYSILTYLIAHVCELRPRTLTFSLAHAFVQTTLFHAVAQQVVRDPKPFPRLRFAEPRKIRNMEDFTADNVFVDEYVSWPGIKAKLKV